MDYYYSPMQSDTNYTKYSLKFFLALVLCLLVRLIPFRAPNIEPILAAAMPLGRAYGALAGFSFGALSIFIYDLATGTLGVRTLFTAGAYGIVGLWAAIYFKNFQDKKLTGLDYAKFAVIGTVFFDVMTGLTVGPIFFDQPFLQAFSGQIPFTALHLVGNVVFAYTLSPGIYNILIKKKEKKSLVSLINFNPKII
jgi:uncharacterized membrane protein